MLRGWSVRQVLLAMSVVCFALLAYGMYLQHVVGLEPCPMCIVQRYALILVGLIAGTAVALFKASVGTLEALVLFALALAALFAWKGRMAIPALILAAAAWGWF